MNIIKYLLNKMKAQIVATPIKNCKEKIKEESKYELNYENKKYNFIIQITESNLLILILKEIDDISSNYYISKNNLDDLIKIDKQFRAYDTINEVYEILKDILNIEKASIQIIKDNLVLNFSFPLPANKKKEIIIPFQIKNFHQKIINDKFIKKIIDLENKLNKEIEENLIYKKLINENKNIICLVSELKEEVINLKNKDNVNNKKINELKEEIRILKDEINDLKIAWTKTNLFSNIIKNKEEYEFIKNRLEIAGNNREIRHKLLYRASIDGDKAKTFHEKCNDIKGTLCLVKTADDISLGGYTEALWNGNGFKRDEKAFCFSLNLRKIYNVSIPQEAIQPSENLGPSFANNLFCIYDESFKNGGGCTYRFKPLYNFHSWDRQYGTIEKDYEITGGKQNFGVKEVEVFQIIFK